ncbi:MAG: trypsin-like peptidase domain-containing protein [Chloroflexi bacterium]|nr:MAG: putative S1B family peptidase [Chloroflexi bacterium OLB13]MBC6957415.1 PDZ domain-containing protein [Chloroflexota bacterium]MBV6437635.1 Serine protease Do-like HtrA [Anaerolineae bacterium]MDL1916654.1 trypsin-like serine protease [Anaerolineae bacterium CFX4]OQY86350.1 MAG: hypothetical protein B6D42_01390 [Anaerolineae bacterium UTCFX5]
MFVPRLNRVAGVLMALILLVAGFALGASVISLTATDAAQAAQLNVNTQGVPLSDIERTYADVYNRVSPSVVAISVLSRTSAGSGSGFVIDKDGHIVTNFHVVDGATAIEVNFLDGTITRAEIVGTDLNSDLAVIRVSDVPADRLFPVTFGSSDELVPGQQVLAIGSPFSQRWTMTAGIVSALDRAISGFTQFQIGGVIQTDAPINPGNSGGPLLNLNGEVVGVNSQISSETRSNSGIGFAVPSDLTRRVAAELIETGTVNYSYIGIQGRDLRLTDAEALGLANNVRGVVVTAVFRDGPAAAADLRPATLLQNNREDISAADIIVGINGEHLLGFDTLISYLAKYTVPGDTITLNVLRGGQPVDVPVTLAPRPAQ